MSDEFISDEDFAKLSDKSESPDFISDQEDFDISAKKQPKFGEISPLSSAISGASQMLTLNQGDEFIGGVKATGSKIMGSSEPWHDLYRKAQKEQQDYTEEAQRQNPKWYMGGQAGGMVIPAIATGGASLPESLGSAVAGGAVKGAVYAAGGSHGNLDDDKSREELAYDTSVGGVLGGATSGASKYAGNLASKATPENLRKYASNKLASGAAGHPWIDKLIAGAAGGVALKTGNTEAAVPISMAAGGVSKYARDGANKGQAKLANAAASAIEKLPDSLRNGSSAQALYKAAKSGLLPEAITRKIIDEYERGN